MPNTHKNGLVVALVLLASAVVAAAPQGPRGPRVEPAAAPSHELVITVADAGEVDGTHTLTCGPAGGDHPEADAACETLLDTEQPFATTDEGTLCTYMYGGPARATVEGVWEGESVSAEFTRSDGCEIARWDALVPALPELVP
ncbi:SSI family serine proteinase inhibitor [Streptomyces millisiae]|uniref:SSI family serine proteinase inhibitor n=1 Tax=Streptomyces millisiae TaxID=3075542 RepID=A0ABU2LKR0_9ACTN|nr:SSI family serine proteinase inhibitor [Streptomyces sp. DSM 44918]MDT0318095.1 SSI family serine proteinase inhibitor [Streptomyces sp. DSM 44918]